MAVSLRKHELYIVRISIWGQWFDTKPMSIEQANHAYSLATKEFPNMNVSIIAKVEY